MSRPHLRVALLGLTALAGAPVAAQTCSADIPARITTPDSVDTRIGTLRVQNGAPDADTTRAVYDNLDVLRGVQAFLTGMSATSVRAMCNGLESVSVKPSQGVGLTEGLMDARSLFLTPNTTTVYGFACLDLTAGPTVLTVPAGVLGPVDDANFRWVNDVGLTGPDAGKGGSYLFVPPGYTGDVPATGYVVQKPTTNTLLFFFRAFVKDGDIQAAVDHVKQGTNLHPLHATTETGEAPKATFVNTSGMQFNTISANDFSFWEELNQTVQAEPADWVDPDTVGLFASIGIVKGQPFAPDDRMKAILTDAVAVGNATARTILFEPRNPEVCFYPDRKWMTPFVGGSYEFLNGAERLLDARAMFFYYATGITPAMAMAKPGSGSASFVVYDNQTRSLLETDQKLAGVDSTAKDLKVASDGSVTVWFGPKAPEGKEANWVQTTPGKGFNVLFRLYGPLEPWFDKSWKPGDFEVVQ